VVEAEGPSSRVTAVREDANPDHNVRLQGISVTGGLTGHDLKQPGSIGVSA